MLVANDLPLLSQCSHSFLLVKRACDGSSCRGCIAALDAVAAGCVDEQHCSLRATARGAQFLQSFHSFRHVTVGGQCANSTLRPAAEFHATPNVVCGGGQARCFVPPPSPPSPPSPLSQSLYPVSAAVPSTLCSADPIKPMAACQRSLISLCSFSLPSFLPRCVCVSPSLPLLSSLRPTYHPHMPRALPARRATPYYPPPHTMPPPPRTSTRPTQPWPGPNPDPTHRPRSLPRRSSSTSSARRIW